MGENKIVSTVPSLTSRTTCAFLPFGDRHERNAFEFRLFLYDHFVLHILLIFTIGNDRERIGSKNEESATSP